MSTPDEISTLIDRLYMMDRLLNAMQKRPIEYAGVPLHANEAHTLKIIAQNEGISQTELSDRMFRTKGATSITVDKLVEKGLVARQRVDEDQRRYLLTLTDLGRCVHMQHLAYDEAHARWAAEKLGVDEHSLRITNQTLDQIIQFYSRHYLVESSTASSPQY